MVRNKMSNLADTLFAQLEYLDDRELSENELKNEKNLLKMTSHDLKQGCKVHLKSLGMKKLRLCYLP
ncbi:TPA: hypothetical protein ACGO38_001183 [Streptococcus suis]